MRKFIKSLLLVGILFLGIGFISQVSANPADMDPSFNIGTPNGFNGSVRSIIKQANGKLLIGGNFSAYQGVNANGVIRLNGDGSIDTSFNIGAGFSSSAVYSMVEQRDGKILVGGAFTAYQGVRTNRIIRLNNDGSRDTSFNLGDGFSVTNSMIYSIIEQTDGKILVGGNFPSYQGISSNKIIRLNSDGNIDTSFNIGDGFSGSSSSSIYSIVEQTDGKILVGGEFTGYQGISVNNIIRLNNNGSIDTGFNIGSGFNSTIRSIIKQADEKIIVGGAFTQYQGSGANRIIRLNSDGSRDVSLNFGGGFNGRLFFMAEQMSGKLAIGGEFTSYQGVSASHIIRLNSDGSKHISLNVGNGFAATIYSIIEQTDGKLVIGGWFSTYQGLGANKIIRLNNDGSRDNSFNLGDGLNSSVMSMIEKVDGKIILGGDFTSYQGVIANRMIRLNSNGSIDSSFNIGAGFGNQVTVMVEQIDGKILAGGVFRTYQGVSTNGIIRLNNDGSRDTNFNIGTGFAGSMGTLVRSIIKQSDGKILVGGEFTTYQGESANRIIRLNDDGSRDTSFDMGSGFEGYVMAMVIQTDGKILVGGNFMTYQGEGAGGIIRLNDDGSRDTSFDMGTGFGYASYNGAITSMIEQADGKVIVGGVFNTYQGSGANFIIRLNSDGSKDSSFNAGFTNRPLSIVELSNGKLVIGGVFIAYQGLEMKYIIRLNSDGSRDTGFDIGDGFSGPVVSIVELVDGKILVGGDFTSYKNGIAGYLIKLYGNTNLVIIPNSTNVATVEAEFTEKGYVRSGIDLVGTTGISLSLTNGNIPVDLNLKNDSIQLTIPANTQFKKKSDNSNYDGIISVPTLPAINTYSIFDRQVISKFKVGSSSEATILEGGVATLKVPVVGKSIGDVVVIYYAEDNGVSWYPKTIASVQEESGELYVEFSTNQLTEFSILDGAGIFTINNDEATTTGQNVILNIDATGITNMRFSNDNIIWSSRESFSTIKNWILSNGGGTKIVYTQLDVNGDQISDIQSNDTIIYDAPDTTAPIGSIVYNPNIATTGNVTATISLNETGIITNNGGNNTYAFTGNGNFTFEFEDLAGNTGEAIATVTWIDKTKPVGTITYSPETSTNGNVIATISLNETGTIINNSGSLNYTFTGNGDFTYEFEDLAGNTGEVIATVTWIDREAPVINGVTSGGIYATTATFTITDNIAVSGVMLNGNAITGRTNAIINTIGTHTIIATDTAGNKTTVVTFEIKQAASSGGGGGSYIQPEEEIETNTGAIIETGTVVEKTVEEELEESYKFAKEKKITTTKDLEEFETDGVLIRKHLAKMISEFAKGVMGKVEITGEIVEGCNNFEDMGEETEEMKGYVTMACKLGLMGWNSDQKSTQKTFNPDVEINRAQFGTILSRLLRGSTYATEDSLKYYEKHLIALNEKGIMKIIDPEMRELRGWVILMLYRVRENNMK